MIKKSPPVRSNRGLHDHVPVHIFTTASGMVGVCLTAIGLIQVLISAKAVNIVADDMLAIDSIFFLTSALLSYMSIRSNNRHRYYKLELIADRIFIFAMLLMVAACLALTYQLEFNYFLTR